MRTGRGESELIGAFTGKVGFRFGKSLLGLLGIAEDRLCHRDDMRNLEQSTALIQAQPLVLRQSD
jgi:hypothetical protein